MADVDWQQGFYHLKQLSDRGGLFGVQGTIKRSRKRESLSVKVRNLPFGGSRWGPCP